MIENFSTDQILFLILIMTLTAIIAGFFAGFFGIGGGIITVPCLFYIFGAVGVDKSYLMHLAVGTSFAIIVPTAMMSVFTHYKHNAVDFGVLKSYGIFVVFGVIIGSFFAASLHTKSLILFFSIVMYLLALNLIFLKDKTNATEETKKAREKRDAHLCTKEEEEEKEEALVDTVTTHGRDGILSSVLPLLRRRLLLSRRVRGERRESLCYFRGGQNRRRFGHQKKLQKTVLEISPR